MADSKISALPASTTPLAGTEVLPIVQSGATKQVSVANLTAGRAISATDVTASGAVYLSTNNSFLTGKQTSGNNRGILGIDSTDYTYNGSYAGYKWTIQGGSKMQMFSSGGLSLSTSPTDPGAGCFALTGSVIQSTAGQGINFTANTPLAGMTSQLLNWYEEGTYTPTILGDTNPTITYTTQTGRYTRIGNLMHFSAVISWSALSGGTGVIRIKMPKAANGQQTGFMVGIANGLSIVSLIGAVDNGYDSFYLRDTTTNNGGVLVSGLGSSGTFVISGTYFV